MLAAPAIADAEGANQPNKDQGNAPPGCPLSQARIRILRHVLGRECVRGCCDQGGRSDGREAQAWAEQKGKCQADHGVDMGVVPVWDAVADAVAGQRGAMDHGVLQLPGVEPARLVAAIGEAVDR